MRLPLARPVRQRRMTALCAALLAAGLHTPVAMAAPDSPSTAANNTNKTKSSADKPKSSAEHDACKGVMTSAGDCEAPQHTAPVIEADALQELAEVSAEDKAASDTARAVVGTVGVILTATGAGMMVGAYSRGDDVPDVELYRQTAVGVSVSGALVCAAAAALWLIDPVTGKANPALGL